MCHDSWTRRERRREERFDEELRYLLEERERSERPAPLVQRGDDDESTERKRVDLEAGTRA